MFVILNFHLFAVTYCQVVKQFLRFACHIFTNLISKETIKMNVCDLLLMAQYVYVNSFNPPTPSSRGVMQSGPRGILPTKVCVPVDPHWVLENKLLQTFSILLWRERVGLLSWNTSKWLQRGILNLFRTIHSLASKAVSIPTCLCLESPDWEKVKIFMEDFHQTYKFT